MSPGSPAETLIQLLTIEISLLQQLHILSQTQYLVLERQDYADLEEIVQKKDNLVEEVSRYGNGLAQALQEEESILSKVSPEQRQHLESLKNEGTRLLDLISKVDAKNHLQLEEFKSQAIQSSHQLHQNRRLRRAYDLPPDSSTQISRLAD